MWSPVHKDAEKNSKQKESAGRSSKSTTRNERPKETREQCNAVKALLFNVDGQTAQSSTRGWYVHIVPFEFLLSLIFARPKFFVPHLPSPLNLIFCPLFCPLSNSQTFLYKIHKSAPF